MATRTMKVRFYGAVKRLTRMEWPDGLIPVDDVADGIDKLVPPNDAIDIGAQTVVGRVRSTTKDYAHLVFYRIRDDLLPLVRAGLTGDILDLGLGQDDDLAEATEVLLCRNGLVLQLVNRDGPGITTISRYVEKATGVDAVMVALIHEDALAQLGRDPELNAVKIRAASGSAEDLARGHPSLRDAGRSADRAPGTRSIEMIYRAEPGQHGRFSRTWMPRMRRLAGTHGVERLTVTAVDEETGRADEVDLLLDKITTRAFVELTSDNRHITAPAALEALLTAYNDQRQVVEGALQALLDEDRAQGG